MRKIYNKIVSDAIKFKPSKIPTRIYLGSSYKPKLTGPGYYQLKVVEGKTEEEIRAMRRATKREMAAFKAHATMGTYGPIPEKPPTEEKQPVISAQPELPKPREFSLYDVTNRDARKTLSDNATLRIRYFLSDLFSLALEDSAERLIANVRESRWWDKGGKEAPSDTQVYSFFDDLTVCARNDYIPEAVDVNRIYRSVLDGRIDDSVQRFITTQQITEKKRLNAELYHELRQQGKTEEEITVEYGASTRQIAAYKAWDTMRTRAESHKNGHTEKPEGDIGLAVARLLGRGVPGEEIMKRWNLTPQQFAGYKAANSRGAYTSRLKSSTTTDTPKFIDSRGVVHSRVESLRDAEQGYRG